jgi:cytochrome c oxidase cbb3-type subunit III
MLSHFLNSQNGILLESLSITQYGLLSLIFVLMVVILILLVSLIQLNQAIQKRFGPAQTALSELDLAMQKRTFWQKLLSLRPLEVEKQLQPKLQLDHAYDGIIELDNPTPPWFNVLFYGTIGFGLLYLMVYHVAGSGQVMAQEYQAEMQVAEVARKSYIEQFAKNINENNVTALTKAGSLESGAAIFKQNCVACHGEKGEGKIGPNLTDDYWLHGGTPKDIFHVIAEGIPDKGMIAWNKSLNPLQIQEVMSYIVTLKGTKPANAKEPQGQKL